MDRDAIAASIRNARANGFPVYSAQTLQAPPPAGAFGAGTFGAGTFGAFLPPAALLGSAEAGSTGSSGVATEAEHACLPLPPALCGGFDVVVANILAAPLIKLAPTIASLAAAPGTALALSGVLRGQEATVVEAYAPFFPDIAVAREMGDWVLLTGTRR